MYASGISHNSRTKLSESKTTTASSAYTLSTRLRIRSTYHIQNLTLSLNRESDPNKEDINKNISLPPPFLRLLTCYRRNFIKNRSSKNKDFPRTFANLENPPPLSKAMAPSPITLVRPPPPSFPFPYQSTNHSSIVPHTQMLTDSHTHFSSSHLNPPTFQLIKKDLSKQLNHGKKVV